MTTDAMLGFATLFKTGNGAIPEIFTALAEVTSVTPPAMSRDSIDATHEESPEGYREFIPGLKDGGEVSLELNFIPGSTTSDDLLAEFDATTNTGAIKNRQIVFPNGVILSFRAFLTAFEPDSPLDDKLALAVTFKVTGKPSMD